MLRRVSRILFVVPPIFDVRVMLFPIGLVKFVFFRLVRVSTVLIDFFLIGRFLNCHCLFF